MTKVEAQLVAYQAQWESSLDPNVTLDGAYDEGLVLRFPFDGNAANATPNKVDSKFLEGEPIYVAGVAGQALDLDGKGYVDAGDVANWNEIHSFSFGAWILPNGQQGGAVLSRMDADKSAGYYLSVVGGKLQAYFGSRLPMDAIHVETAKPISPDLWRHVMVTYDGSRSAQGVKVFVDGQLAELTIKSDSLRNSLSSSQPLRIGSRGAGDRFRGCIDEVCFYDRELTAEEVSVVACGDSIDRIAATASSDRTPTQRSKLRSYFVRHHASEAARQACDRVQTLKRDRQRLEKAVATSMVMQEQNPPRDTFVLVRGEYDKPGEKVERGLPASLPPLPAGAANDRLGFARWLVDSANPLTARVAGNRFWQMYFGVGLVKSTEDFGAQGEPPSHPELLDWLATEFVRTGWDVKAMQRLIVTSATYRQSSKVSPAQLAIDPENRLLARGARFRLPAGTIRDSALAAAGLLVEKIGGPSVKPYQPPGLWEELTAAKYDQGHGEDLYRRSLYTFWKRTIAPPGMMTFDASSRETCIVRPMRTNTPLQALARLNEVTYVEAARGLAQRMLLEGGSAPGERLTFAFRLATGRHPSGEELRVLAGGLDKQLARYRADPASAERLIAFGESKHNEGLKATELAAYTAVAEVILNVDEALTKE